MLKSIHVHVISEKTPERLAARAEYVKNASLIIACVDRSFQQSTPLMEIVHFIKERRTPFYALNTNTVGTFVPFGALGAIVCGTELGLISLEYDAEETKQLDCNAIVDKIMSNYEESVVRKSADKSFMQMKPIVDPSRVASAHVEVKYNAQETPAVDLLISCHSQEAQEIVQLIEGTLRGKEIKFVTEQTDVAATNYSAALSSAGTKVGLLYRKTSLVGPWPSRTKL
jgi:hypothetical protein